MNCVEKTPTAPRGFTLIEVLLAVAIFAIVLVAINGVFYGALRLRNKTTQSLDAAVPVQQTLAIIRQDLRGIVAPTGGPLSGSLKSGAGAQSGAAGQESSPEMYTTSGTLDAESPWPSVQKVSYVLRPPLIQSTAGGQDLYRLVTRNLLATIQDEPLEQFLMGDVAQLGFSYYDGTQWRTSWDSTTEITVLPKAIRVEIQLTGGAADRRAQTPIQLVVPLVAQPNANQTQSTGT